jgi:hypothetical protein
MRFSFIEGGSVSACENHDAMPKDVGIPGFRLCTGASDKEFNTSMLM